MINWDFNRVFESVTGVIPNNLRYYHGTRSTIPFKSFDPRSDGTGIVSSGGKKYGGFFFTSNFENAEYYTEWFVLTVEISNINNSPVSSNHPTTVLQQAIKDRMIYKIDDIVDGMYVSDIVIVPNGQLNNVKIIKWDFISDRETYFEQLDMMFKYDDDDEVINQDMINSFFSMVHEDINYALTVPIFKEYYVSKQ